MSRKTALVVLTTLIVGALLWSALTHSTTGTGAPSPPEAAAGPIKTRTAAMQRAVLESSAAAAADTQRTTSGSTDATTELTLRIRRRSGAFAQGDYVMWKLDGEGRETGMGFATREESEWVTNHHFNTWKGDPVAAAVARGEDGLEVRYGTVPPGLYQLAAAGVFLSGQRDVRSPPQQITLQPGAQTVELWLDEQERDAGVRLRCTRGGVPYEGEVRYAVESNGLLTDVLDETRRTKDGFHLAPSGVSFDVRVESFPGHELFPAVAPQHIELQPGERRTVVFELPAGRPVSIQCVSPHGERVEASLAMWRVNGDQEVPIDVATNLREEKNAWWGYLPPGTWFVRMGPRTQYATAGERFETATGSALQIVRVSVRETGSRVRLLLREEDGQPVADGQFNLNRIGADAQQSEFYIGSLSQGEAVSRPLSAGRYWLFLWRRGSARRVQLAEDRDAVINDVLPAPLAPDDTRPGVHGRVVDHARTPLGAIRVLCRAEDSPWHWMTRTRRDGSFRFEGLPPGAYEVVVPAKLLDERMRLGTRLKVLLTESPAEVTLRLPPR